MKIEQSTIAPKAMTRGFSRLTAANASGIAAGATILASGGTVAFPTETVYGLGADATSAKAIAKIYAAKGRPSFNPLIAHVANIDAAKAQAIFSAPALALAEAFWPGPLTLVLPLTEGATICELARSGLESVALRVPAHPIARALIEAAGLPIAAPSANRSGHVSPVTADHVAEDLADSIDLILDAGPCPIGVESTIVSCLSDGPVLLRPGGIARNTLESVLGRTIGTLAEVSATPDRGRRTPAMLAPGMLASHYAPKAKLRLEAKELAPGEAGLDFGGLFSRAGNVLDLSPDRDLFEAAANLFSYLRQLDKSGEKIIAVAPVPEQGLGEAINDRLRRAAAPRT
jgi:L-threonylcarbamoyladenylate synthase